MNNPPSPPASSVPMGPLNTLIVTAPPWLKGLATIVLIVAFGIAAVGFSVAVWTGRAVEIGPYKIEGYEPPSVKNCNTALK